ncbi:redoxin domain-containing protein [Agromyces subbeticus]|uniref:redoxin domain-containing protein n=1 Tax=Agromyces subbeticus TaxID=293890 RepID=UPI0003B52DF5|nr:redoxin domain-containing protein [Agromyces subbeticus]
MPQPIVPAVGSALPDIALVDARGLRSTLAVVRDGRRAIVYFMRSSTCPVCLAHAGAIERLFDAGEVADAAFVLILPGGARQAVVTERSVRRARGTRAEVWASGAGHDDIGLGRFLGLQHSGTFVVDEEGVLLAVRARALPTGNFSRNEVVTALTRATDASAEPQSRELHS